MYVFFFHVLKSCASTRSPLPKMPGAWSLDVRVQRKKKICGSSDSHNVAQKEFKQRQTSQSAATEVCISIFVF